MHLNSICLYEVALHQAILNSETNTPNFIILCPSTVVGDIKEERRNLNPSLNRASPSLSLVLLFIIIGNNKNIKKYNSSSNLIVSKNSSVAL